MLPSVQLYVLALYLLTHCRHGGALGACGRCDRHAKAMRLAARQRREQRRAER